MSGWRPVATADVPAVLAVADQVHPGLFESDAVFAEKLALFPPGCLVLEQDRTIRGYIISHPWASGTPPKLNTMLGALPARPGCYYIQDLACLPAARGSGAGSAGAAHVLALADALGLRRQELVSVYATAPFWARLGFVATALPDPEALAGYGPAAVFMRRGA